MELLTAQEVAEILKASRWFVYKHYEALGGFKIGALVRFDKEQLFEKLKEVMTNGLPTPREMDVRFLEDGSEAPEGRLQEQTGRGGRRGNGQKKPQGDEYGLHRLMREPPKRT